MASRADTIDIWHVQLPKANNEDMLKSDILGIRVLFRSAITPYGLSELIIRL